MPTCPITPAELGEAMLSGQFRRMDETDLGGCAGIEGTGWVWGRPDRVLVCADQVGDRVVFNVIGPDGEVWLIVAALGEPRAIASTAA